MPAILFLFLPKPTLRTAGRSGRQRNGIEPLANRRCPQLQSSSDPLSGHALHTRARAARLNSPATCRDFTSVVVCGLRVCTPRAALCAAGSLPRWQGTVKRAVAATRAAAARVSETPRTPDESPSSAVTAERLSGSLDLDGTIRSPALRSGIDNTGGVGF
ncbi:hypothetical protein PVAP13_1KG535750 [Panicum virgatum]|uniref:Uncharacterized protein n=1 Tax=Panicum virgatum TaxID=38727 RepID=A0A8T0XLS2_PANVG|nr:hypothetical protein PVAP13_1KG535750 [Panicum virgatum]